MHIAYKGSSDIKKWNTIITFEIYVKTAGVTKYIHIRGRSNKKIDHFSKTSQRHLVKFLIHTNTFKNKTRCFFNTIKEYLFSDDAL